MGQSEENDEVFNTIIAPVFDVIQERLLDAE